MSAVVPQALMVSPDEPCYWLDERIRHAPGNRGLRRYQTCWVVRNDRLAEHKRDMGPVSKWKDVQEFQIPGGVTDTRTGRIQIEHTVGELRDIAELLRDPSFERPEFVPTDFEKAFHESRDIKQRRAKGQKTFGLRERRN